MEPDKTVFHCWKAYFSHSSRTRVRFYFFLFLSSSASSSFVLLLLFIWLNLPRDFYKFLFRRFFFSRKGWKLIEINKNSCKLNEIIFIWRKMSETGGEWGNMVADGRKTILIDIFDISKWALTFIRLLHRQLIDLFITSFCKINEKCTCRKKESRKREEVRKLGQLLIN